jgi:25S rRNA (cytosine2278-C5)-methyltransferase
VHDLLHSRKGIALPEKHGLYLAVTRHKARLVAELTRARLRRGCTTIDALRSEVESYSDDPQSSAYRHPRWIRVNTLRSSLQEQLEGTFANYRQTRNIADLTKPTIMENVVYIDEHIPNLLAIPARCDLSKSPPYREGKLIYQDKASCFPAYLLDPLAAAGDIIDACSAPGNKTTHLAAITSSSNLDGIDKINIFACEKDPIRSITLSKMVNLACADKLVSIKPRQDFLRLDPHAKEYADVTCLLLDPSCSGSGIVGRDETTVSIHLPGAANAEFSGPRGKKRKRHTKEPAVAVRPALPLQNEVDEENFVENVGEGEKLQARLSALSDFQLRLLKHAMEFPAAKRITYSTCSIHDEENEHVVVQALVSDVALNRAWRIMRRNEQVEGLSKWHIRGSTPAVKKASQSSTSGEMKDTCEDIAEGCIRCSKDSEDGTMGFFVAGFVRDLSSNDEDANGINDGHDDIGEDEEEWNGFSEDDQP